MKFAAAWIVLLITQVAWAQAPGNDYVSALNLARLKNYSAARVSSGNRFVASNDDSKRIMPGETLVMADLKGPGMVSHIWLTVADNEYGWPRLLRIRVYYDGYKTPSVDAPLGDFFGVGHGSERNLNSIMIHDSSFGRARNSYWPMPYHKSCRITVTNEGNRLVSMFYYHVDYRTYASLPADIGYFHAYYHQERPARKGHNYEFLNIKGTGQYVGTVLSVVQTQVSWFGEGDDLFYIDGAKKPQILGTGSEDYFNDAWGLRDSDGPWTGTPIAEGERVGSRLTGYRWHVPDPIPFTKSLWAGIEHAGWTANPDGSVRSGFEERPDYFSSVAFWYQKGVNEGLPEPPYGYARLDYGNATQIAVEDSIKDVTVVKGTAVVQQEVDWGKDLLSLKADGVGSRINIPIDIPETATYELIDQIALAPDHGNYITYLDGKNINLDPRQAATSEIPFPGPEVFFNYLPEVYVARDRALGTIELTKGRHILSFECVSKDSHSAGYNFGIQDVVLEKVPTAEETSEIQVPEQSPASPATGGPIYRGRVLSDYLTELKSSSDAGRLDALYAIGAFGSDAGSAVGLVKDELSNSDVRIREAALAALGEIGPVAAPAAPFIGKTLSDPRVGVRIQAAIALRSIGLKAASEVPQLTAALNDSSSYVRSLAAQTLGTIGPQAHAAIPSMTQRLLQKGESGLVIGSVLTSLENMGPAASEVLPTLKQMQQKNSSNASVERAILLIEGKEVPTYR